MRGLHSLPPPTLAVLYQGRGEWPEAGAHRHLQTLAPKKASGLVLRWGSCDGQHRLWLTVHLGSPRPESFGCGDLTLRPLHVPAEPCVAPSGLYQNRCSLWVRLPFLFRVDVLGHVALTEPCVRLFCFNGILVFVALERIAVNVIWR